jgi:hypothetical protein
MTRTLAAALFTTALMPLSAFADPATDASIAAAHHESKGAYSLHSDRLFDNLAKQGKIDAYSTFSTGISTSRVMNSDLGDTKYTTITGGGHFGGGSVTGFMAFGNPDQTDDTVDFNDDVFSFGATFTDDRVLGFGYRTGFGYTEGELRITRDDSGGAEPGSGQTSMSTLANMTEVNYGFEMAREAVMQPFFRLESALQTRKGYTEDSGSTELVTHDTHHSLDARIVLGTRAEIPLQSYTALHVDAGMTKELLRKGTDLSGSYGTTNHSIDTIDPSDDAQFHLNLGLSHEMRGGGVFSGSLGFRQSPYSDEITTTVEGGYAHRF